MTKRQRLGLATLIPTSPFLAGYIYLHPTSATFGWKGVVLVAVVVIAQAFVYGDK